jgi:hypothetical protein
VEFPVCLLKGLGHTLDGVYDLQTAEKLGVNPAGITNQTKDRDLLTLGHMNVNVHALQPLHQMFHLVGGGTMFQNCDHNKHLLTKITLHELRFVQRMRIRFRTGKELQHKTLLPFTKEKVIVVKEKLCSKNDHFRAPFRLLWTLYHHRWNNARAKFWFPRIFPILGRMKKQPQQRLLCRVTR